MPRLIRQDNSEFYLRDPPAVDSGNDLESMVTDNRYDARSLWVEGAFQFFRHHCDLYIQNTAWKIANKLKMNGQIFNMEIDKRSQINQSLSMILLSGMTEN